ncbi:intelectin-like [Chanodichthys erythropterus]|uniref:intelectin-like n=1 Tax=Chanodichthys erythropterus TaxID=933992 RepID=UPI00351DB5ED
MVINSGLDSTCTTLSLNPQKTQGLPPMQQLTSGPPQELQKRHWIPRERTRRLIRENHKPQYCWSSDQGSNANRPDGEGTWANKVTFGTAEAATSDDYKNPGYFEITAQDVSVWHVPNNMVMENWSTASILRYHTENRFLTQHGGNLFNLFKKFPVSFGIGTCKTDNGPAIPIVYDTGNVDSTKKLYGPNTSAIFEPGFITFRVFNNEKAAMALCSGVKPTGCDTEHFCVGGGGHFPEAVPRQCGDFPSFDWDGYGTNTGWSASKEITEAAVLLFYR